MRMDISVSRGFIVGATLVRVVEAVLLLFGSEHDVKGICLISGWSNQKEA